MNIISAVDCAEGIGDKTCRQPLLDGGDMNGRGGGRQQRIACLESAEDLLVVLVGTVQGTTGLAASDDACPLGADGEDLQKHGPAAAGP